MPVSNSFHRQFSEFGMCSPMMHSDKSLLIACADPRMGGNPYRHHSIGEYDGGRGPQPHSPSSSYPQNQRYGPRPSEAEQVMQAKRKAAAQRERELRNYHQEQQYNRSESYPFPEILIHFLTSYAASSGPKPDRTLSPNAVNEDERRDLIARQHRALYGNDSNLYMGDSSSPRPMSQDARVLAATSGGHMSSPMGYEAFSAPTGGPGEVGSSKQAMPGQQQRSRSNSTTSPAANAGGFPMYEHGQQQQQHQQVPNQTSSSSPGASPTRQGSMSHAGGVAPIGTRPHGQAKRNTPPQPSPLGYGYGGEQRNQNSNERSQSSASNPASAGPEKSVNMGWNGQSGWGQNKMQASVWG